MMQPTLWAAGPALTPPAPRRGQLFVLSPEWKGTSDLVFPLF